MTKKLCLIILLTATCVTHLLSQEVGNATYYHKKFEGRRTSDGGTYHRDSLTCAHKSYPFGTLLWVKNPRNGKEIIVKVTDRGPFNRRLMIDLSYRAAETLDIIRYGVAQVEVTPFRGICAPYHPPPLKITRFMDIFTQNPIPYTPKIPEKVS